MNRHTALLRLFRPSNLTKALTKSFSTNVSHPETRNIATAGIQVHDCTESPHLGAHLSALLTEKLEYMFAMNAYHIGQHPDSGVLKKYFEFRHNTDTTGYFVHAFHATKPNFAYNSFSLDLDRAADTKALFGAFDQLMQADSNIFGIPGWTLLYNQFGQPFAEWFRSRFPHRSIETCITHVYFVPEQAKENFLQQFSTRDKIPIADGYFFDDAKPEEDYVTVTEAWAHSRDYEAVKAKLKYLPNVVIRHENSPEPVAFKLTDPHGFMTHLYCHPEHRGRGLARSCDYALNLQLLKRGVLLYQDVEPSNTRMISCYTADEFNVRWEREGEPVTLWFYKID